jgi:hypothetical protein
MTLIDRFSRGPIREGIEMFTMGNWVVRGFIRNVASGLDYRIHGWELYRFGQGTPVDSMTNEVYPFLPDQTEYTDWYDTGLSGGDSKIGYYTAAWDWEVGWGASLYSGLSEATIILPVMLEIDAWADKTVLLTQNSESGTALSVQDLARHIGHSGLQANRVTINSVLPRLSVSGAANTWNPANIRVLFINGSGTTDITSLVAVTTQQAGVTDGFVNVNIPDVTAVIGRGLMQNEDIRLEYTVTGSSNPVSQNYSFCQTTGLLTVSGTPVYETFCQYVIIPGVGGVLPPGPEPEPGGPGGGGGAVIPPALYADIVREMGEGYFVADNLVHVLAKYLIVDTGDKGVKDIKAVIYVPEHGTLDLSSLKLSIYDSSAGRVIDWVQGRDYTIADNGLIQIGPSRYREYAISKASGGGLFQQGLDLFNNDRIELDYVTTVPVGTTYLITRVAGYNYYQDKYIFEDMYIPVRREGVLQDLEIQSGEWQMAKVYVGDPVRWIRDLIIKNPNNVSVEHLVSVEVFKDTLSSHLIMEGGEGRESLEIKEGNATYVDILVRLGPGETRTYALEAMTPPVLEVKRAVDVVESTEREITFVMNITLEIFALEDYYAISLIFDAAPSKIVSITEHGAPLNFTEYDEGSSDIMVGRMSSGQRRSLSIVYKEVPPILLTSMNSVMFGCSDYANLTVFVIPSERETGSYIEVEITGPQPQLNTVRAHLVEMKDIWPWEEVKVPVTIDLRSMADGRYFVNTRFKKNFQTILTDQSDFTVSCPERMVISVSWVGFLAVAVLVCAYLVLRSWRRRREAIGLGELKKKLRSLE